MLRSEGDAAVGRTSASPDASPLQALPRLMQLVENFTDDILVMNFG